MENDDEVEADPNAQTNALKRTTSHTSRLSRRRSSVIKSLPFKNKAQRKRDNQRARKLAAAIEEATPAPSSSATSAVPSVPAVPQSMPLPTRPLPLLICSIGNPGTQYANTLHSAGHTVLNALAERLGYPGFRKEKSWGNGLLSTNGGSWALWQSTSYMNESGKGVMQAWRRWGQEEGRVVIVHDELEKALGNVSMREAGSARGHNGIKSILAHCGGKPFWRIGVGVGRPVSRESGAVAQYVLKKMDAQERRAVEGAVEGVIEQLKGIEGG